MVNKIDWVSQRVFIILFNFSKKKYNKSFYNMCEGDKLVKFYNKYYSILLENRKKEIDVRKK